MSTHGRKRVSRLVTIMVDGADVHGVLSVPDGASALVVLAYGTGDSRNAPATRKLIDTLNRASLATLACDLLTPAEETIAALSGEYRGDATLQSDRLRVVLDWCAAQPELMGLPVGLVGAGFGVDAVVLAASIGRDRVSGIVLYGGRIDKAWSSIPLVEAPTMLVVGALDTPLVASYENAIRRFQCASKQLRIVPEASHLFIEPGTREQLGEVAAQWFLAHVAGTAALADEYC